jgi:hypothetical protein
MSLKNDLLGSFVFIFAIIGFFLSTHVVDGRIVRKDELEKSSDFAEDERQKSVAQVQPESIIPEGSMGRGKYCLDMNGKPFGWHWANIPFAALACDDASLQQRPVPVPR